MQPLTTGLQYSLVNSPARRPETVTNAAAPLAVIPAGITAVQFEGSHTTCQSFELAADCAAAS